MRHLLILLAVATFAGCARPPPDVEEAVGELRSTIPADWKIFVSRNTIRIRSDNDVWLVPWVSRERESAQEEIALGNGYKTKYEIMLSFVPLLTTNQYADLKVKRAPFLYILEHGAETKDAYSSAARGYNANRVPTFFTASSSVFVDRPDVRFNEVVPSNTLFQAEAILAKCRQILMPYED